MSKTDFGNEQEMAQADKLHPSLGPTEGSQDVANHNRQVVPMPQFSDPNRPMANSGSVNLALADHPVEHAEDYGELVPADEVSSVQGLHAKELQSVTPSRDMTVGADGSRVFPSGTALPDAGTTTAPEDRDDWKKDDWKNQAQEYGLAVSGNMDTLRARVEEYETDQSDDNADDDDS